MKISNYSFVSILTTDEYLDGVLVLKYSLESTQTRYPFVLLITPNVSKKVKEILISHDINFITVQGIEGPRLVKEDHLKRWNYTYSKLNVFGLTQFDKLVYLDSDMLILQNIDELFDKPHMSAVMIRGKLPEFSSWNIFNSGLLVIEPSMEVFNDMISKIGQIEEVASPSDEDLLNAYYSDWSGQGDLHLDNGYNIFSYHWHRYKEVYGYDFLSNNKPIKIVHYIGEDKPWRLYKTYKAMSLWQVIYQFFRRFKYPELRMLHQANYLWFKCYKELLLKQ
jgi:glycogenin glucosyltransferase